LKVASVRCQDLESSLRLEWLETNGRGGYASGTVAGANTRRYHALLLVARQPQVDRVVLVNHLEEWVEAGDHRFPLSTNLYRGAVHPGGYRHCEGFSSDPCPTWRYAAYDIELEREVLCPHGRDMVVIRWRLVGQGSSGITLRVRPMLSGRDYHATHRENTGIQSQAAIEKGQVTWQPYDGLPPVQAFHNGQYRHGPDWYRDVEYRIEHERGLDHVEDWWSPGECVFDLVPAETAELVLTTETLSSVDVGQIVAEERRRREGMLKVVPTNDRLTRRLWTATAAYLVRRGDRQTVMAGYPWFTDWGRDTFISLPGLCLVTGRYEIARQVLKAFASQVSQGIAHVDGCQDR